MTATVKCPVCSAEVPVPLSSRPNAQGLSLGIDDTLIEEHIDMHRNCSCYWAHGAITFIDADCVVHVPASSSSVQDIPGLFPDLINPID